MSVTINGKTYTGSGGNCNCDDVGGNVNCGGSCNCNKVYGSVTAGGSVSI